MTKKDFKRYQEIGAEIEQLNQDILDCTQQIKQGYLERDFNGAKRNSLLLIDLLKGLYKRETIREELILPQHLKLEGALKEIDDFILNAKWEGDRTDFIEEYISIYLLDNYNHNHHDFYYHFKGEDIYVTNIRWNKNQLLEQDLKLLKKGEIRVIQNGCVLIKRHYINPDLLVVNTYDENKGLELTLKQTVQYLKNNYYM